MGKKTSSCDEFRKVKVSRSGRVGKKKKETK
jgi:hypothetical protein